MSLKFTLWRTLVWCRHTVCFYTNDHSCLFNEAGVHKEPVGRAGSRKSQPMIEIQWFGWAEGAWQACALVTPWTLTCGGFDPGFPNVVRTSLTPRRRVLLRNLIGHRQASPVLYGILTPLRKCLNWQSTFRHFIDRNRLLVHNLSHMEPIHALPSYLLFCFNIMLSPTRMSFMWFLSFSFYHQNSLCIGVCSMRATWLLSSFHECLTRSINHEAPRCAVFSILLLLPQS